MDGGGGGCMCVDQEWREKSSRWIDYCIHSIKGPNCILSISRVLKLHEGEAGGVARHPHVPQSPVLAEGLLDLATGCIGAQVADIDFATWVPVLVAGHGAFCKGRSWAVSLTI